MFAEDLTLFFDVDGGFAVQATRTPVGGGAATSGAVIFDANGLELEALGVVTSAPGIVVPANTWTGLAEGDAIAIGTANYRVRQVYPKDDGALSVAVLAKA